MTGRDAQKYEYTKEKLKSIGLELSTHYESFKITSLYSRGSYGLFPNLDAVFDFACGFEYGKSERTK
jgi:hypothetical protein